MDYQKILSRAQDLSGKSEPLRKLIRPAQFRGSAPYWEQRYQEGGNSGAGSYGRIAEFKAEVLNRFVADHEIGSVLEFGCGDGAQLTRAAYPRYVGLDVSRTAIRLCTDRFSEDPTKSFIFYDPLYFQNRGVLRAELGLSLDVVLHLVEDDVLTLYLRQISEAASSYLLFFTEKQAMPSTAEHVRFRGVERLAGELADWRLIDEIENPYKGEQSQADFFVFERN